MNLSVDWTRVNTELLKQVIFQEKKSADLQLSISDHVMTNVEELCDDILMIRDGRVVSCMDQSRCPTNTGKRVSLFQVNESKEEWRKTSSC